MPAVTFTKQRGEKAFVGTYIDIEDKRRLAALALLRGTTLSDTLRELVRESTADLQAQTRQRREVAA